MISMNLHQAAAVCGSTLIGKAIGFRGVSTDSRLDCNGTLFVALSGENFNGEDYCRQAVENGAVAVMVRHTGDVDVPQLVCNDTLQALSELSKSWAKRCNVKVVAITGSNGKTTVKNMVKSILSQSHSCMATEGNYNNEIGVPLTLCKMDPENEFAVIEMGAAKLGDIESLVSLVQIDTAVLTNASAAHIGRFGSIENIINEKGKIVSGLTSENVAVLPADDANFEHWRNSTQGKVISFGESENADVRVSVKDSFDLITPDSVIPDINLPLPGLHNRLNAAAATCVALSFGISANDIKTGLENFEPEKGRLQNLGIIGGNRLINDSYNANMQSVKAAIDVLADYSGKKTLVFGDMAELGNESLKMHKKIGEYARDKNIDCLLTVGKDSAYAGNEFSNTPLHFGSLKEIEDYMVNHWTDLGTILFKGSRSMRLENLIDGLLNEGKVA